jgi:class 3 adenylate cyclase/tetratricopeptide (TPR) repeat protein
MCGAALVQTPVREQRKTVTVLFSDVTGSTSLGEQLDPESLRRVMTRYFEAMQAVVERHGGTVEKFIGDAIMAVFGVPLVHEDDALRAVRAADEMRSELAMLNDELAPTYGVRIASRTGVNTGEVLAGDPAEGQSFVSGDAVNVAARLEQAARAGEVLLGKETHRLVRDAVTVEPVAPLELKGKAAAVPALRLLSVVPGAEGVTRRLDTALVGRDDELRLLRDALARAVRERACHLFTLLGAPGVGKSRLAGEFLSSLAGAAVVARGRCLPYGEGITYWPVAEAIRQALGLREDAAEEVVHRTLDAALGDEPNAQAIAQRVMETLGLAEGSAATEETFWALRKLFEALAAGTPVVLVLDDIQWGEPTFLDFVEHVADWSRGAPILLFCMARPELLDVRPAWAGGKLNATTVLLEPLDASESATLIDGLLGSAELDEAARNRIAASAEGNPLFLEEMIGMLIDDGVLRRDNGRWDVTADLSAIAIPPTMRALLAARLDRLREDERVVIERASVEGQVFHRGAVAALAPEPARAAVPSNLMALVRRELIRPDRPAFTDDEAFRFRHLLIRDAAYDGLPKEARAELHERFADWLERKVAERAGEYAEIVGYHLEEAARYRTELAPGDAASVALAERAGRQLAVAGRRAAARGDVAASAKLLSRAAMLLRRDDPERLELLPQLGDVVSETGDMLAARRWLEEAIELGHAVGDRRTEWRAVASEAWWRLNVDEIIDIEEVERRTRAAIAELEALGDDVGLSYAWRAWSDIRNLYGEGAKWIEGMARAFEHARRSESRQQQYLCLHILGGAMYFGPTPVGEGIARLEAIEAEIGDDVLLQPAIDRTLGGFIACSGRIEEGFERIERGRSALTELGWRWALAGIPFIVGTIATWVGDLATAEREFRFADAEYVVMRDRGRRSSIVASLADACYLQGRFDEADRLAVEALELAAPDDAQPQAGAGMVRAQVRAQRGHVEDAAARAHAAVAISDATDFLNQRAFVRLGLAEILDLAGERAEAADVCRTALELSEQKGNVLLARLVQTRLDELAG